MPLFFRQQGCILPAGHDAAQTSWRCEGNHCISWIALSSEEAAVNQAGKPVKEKVREWLRREISERRPPPDISEIRRVLGWETGSAPAPDKRGRRKP